MSDRVTTTTDGFAVRTASAPNVRYAGDGEWFAACNRPGCEEWCVGRSRHAVERLIDAHVKGTHG